MTRIGSFAPVRGQAACTNNEKAMSEISKQMLAFMEFARARKSIWLKRWDSGDIPPIARAVHGGVPLATVTAPAVDKYMGLQAAQILQQGFFPDTIEFMTDAHMALDTAGKTPEQIRQQYPPGSMQKMCDEEGACALGQITDCLPLMIVSKDGTIEMITLPYSYHGKGSKFRWAEPTGHIIPDGKESHMEGTIPDALRRIMAEPPMYERHPALKAMSEGADPEKVRFWGGRGCLSVLRMQGYDVEDLITPMRPDLVASGEM